MESYQKIEQLLGLIENVELRTKVLKMHVDFKDAMIFFPASRKRHHKHIGGYADHILQVIQIGIGIYRMLAPVTKFDFTEDDVILVAYVHDLDKLQRYQALPPNDWRRKEKYGSQQWDIREGLLDPDESAKVTQMCAKYGIILTDLQLEGVSHHHGGFSCNLSSVYAYNLSMTKFSTIISAADLLSGNVFGGDCK